MTDDHKSYTVWWDQPNGVVRTDWLRHAVCTLPVAHQVTADIRGLGQGRVLSLVDLRPLKSIDRESRQYFMGDHSAYRAVALVADAPVSRMIANFFLGMFSQAIPVRMFAADDAAIDWLQQQP
ncbi:MAG: STAS/SEC14 domain-containing protein [Nocardioidaceae bacterium]